MQVDAILVLGCRVLPNGRPCGALSRRIAIAVGEARAHEAARVVACGGRRWEGAMEADVIAQALVRAGVDRARIVEERRSLTTLENLREARRLVGDVPLAIVTCDWHCPRASAIAHVLGMRAETIPARSTTPRIPRLLRAFREWVNTRFDVALARRAA